MREQESLATARLAMGTGLDARGALGHIEGVGPEAGGGVDDLHDGFDGVEVLLELSVGNDEWRRDLEDHEVVAAHLREDVVVLEEAHDEHLAEHAGMDGPEGLEGNAQAQGSGRLQDDPVEHAESAHLRKHLEAAETLGELVAQLCAHAVGARSELFLLDDVEGGEADAHGESVFAEGGGVDDGFLERAVDRFIDGVGHQDGSDGDEASAESFRQNDHVGVHAFAVCGDEGSGAADSGLHLVEYEERAVFFAERLDGCQVVGRRRNDAGLALERLEDDGGDLVLAEGGIERGEIAEGNLVGLWEQRTESFLPEVVAHQGERSAGKAVEGAFGVDDAVAAGEDAGELDDGFDALAAGAAEEGLGEVRTGERGEALRKSAGGVGDVALQHGGAGGLQLANERIDDIGVIVPGVVDAVAGEKVEDDATVVGVELGAGAAAIVNIHTQKTEQTNPLRIDEVSIGGVGDG